jgi:hypothetical protein
MGDERHPDPSAGGSDADTAPRRSASADEEILRDTAPEVDGPADADGPEKSAGGSGPARRLQKGGAALAEVARDSAAGVVRGSAAATREGAGLAERASRVVYWPALLCVLGAILLQVRLPGKLTVGPQWLLPALEGVLLIGLAVTTPRGRVDEDHPARRRVAIALVALVNAANVASLYLLVHELLHKHVSNGHSLILSGVAIWLTNVLIFALWYWLLDRGGPAKRAQHHDPTTPEGHPDFVFPEMDGGRPYTPESWMPGFLDYLALALTTATAFSPTDAMPNSRQAKTLMSIQGLVSLVTLGLIISRAVNLLG